MKLVRDSTHTYHGFWSPGAVCRLRIYTELGKQPVVIATELPENKNTSITNLAEELACEVSLAYLDGVLPIWIEHYPERGRGRSLPESFELVTFSDYSYRERVVVEGGEAKVLRRFGKPSWRRIKRSEVRALIGASL